MVFEGFRLSNPKIIESDLIYFYHSSEEPLDLDENKSYKDSSDTIKINILKKDKHAVFYRIKERLNIRKI